MFLTSMRKRVFDIVGCFAGLGIFGPIFAIIATLIYLEERKTIFFIQERIGLNGKRLRVFKFRTMTDGNVTRVGKWLRKTGLDELPQYLNIIRGDLSIVGPRPLTQFDIDRLKWQGNAFRWQMKPGLTGLAQIRSGSGADQSLQADLEYFQTASFYVDCKIIAVSFMMNIFGKRKVQAKLNRWLTKAS